MTRRAAKNPDYNRPHWFDREKYTGLEKLSDLGWCFQIEARRDLLRHLECYKQDADPLTIQVLRKLDCVRHTPVVTLKSIRASNLEVHDFWYLACFLIQRARRRFVGTLDSMSLYRFRHCDWIELIELDLSAPDAVIRSDFEDVLSQLRDVHLPLEDDEQIIEPIWKPSRKRSNSSRGWSLKGEKISAQKLIEFVDLTIWEAQKGHKKIPAAAKERLLFSDPDCDDDSSELQDRSSKKEENHIDTISRQAFAMMNKNDPAYVALMASASAQLQRMYDRARQGIDCFQDLEFLLTEAERLELERRISDEDMRAALEEEEAKLCMSALGKLCGQK